MIDKEAQQVRSNPLFHNLSRSLIAGALVLLMPSGFALAEESALERAKSAISRVNEVFENVDVEEPPSDGLISGQIGHDAGVPQDFGTASTGERNWGPSSGARRSQRGTNTTAKEEIIRAWGGSQSGVNGCDLRMYVDGKLIDRMRNNNNEYYKACSAGGVVPPGSNWRLYSRQYNASNTTFGWRKYSADYN